MDQCKDCVNWMRESEDQGSCSFFSSLFWEGVNARIRSEVDYIGAELVTRPCFGCNQFKEVSMGRCKRCQHWLANEVGQRDYGTCNLFDAGWSSENGAAIDDDGHERSSLTTRPEFGCMEFKEKVVC